MLEFPDNSFDLVNHRLGMGWLRKWDWSKLLREYYRVCKPGGTVRVTEGDLPIATPALNSLNVLVLQAFSQAGNSTSAPRGT